MSAALSEEQHRVVDHIERLVAAAGLTARATRRPPWPGCRSRPEGERATCSSVAHGRRGRGDRAPLADRAARVGVPLDARGRGLRARRRRSHHRRHVRARALLDVSAGSLVEVLTADAVLSRRGGGPWRREATPLPRCCNRGRWGRCALRRRSPSTRSTPSSGERSGSPDVGRCWCWARRGAGRPPSRSIGWRRCNRRRRDRGARSARWCWCRWRGSSACRRRCSSASARRTSR